CLVAAMFFIVSILPAQCPPDVTVNGPGTGSWTAPATGGPWLVQISANGAGGGASATNAGGGGANIIGTFTIQNGHTIFAIAGGSGGDGSGNGGGGGGGASGAVNCGIGDCSLGSIIIMAAGGNGGEDGPGLGGSTSSGSGNPGASGADGQGGGGGAVNSGGANGGSGGGAGGGIVFRNALSGGGAGGSDGGGNGGSGGNGMGGGGGGGTSSSAGSGGASGQTGAAGGNTASALSFNSGSNPQGTPGGTGGAAGDGSVIITCLGSLPIELVSFKAHIQQETVRLLWSTATEKNNHGFEIERSIDNLQWTTLGFVAGNGTSTEQHDYDFSDDRPHAGVNFYRLKQMDTDGGFEYSPMVVADIRSTAQFDVFPNPAVSGALTFRAVSSISGDATLRIFDWMGHQVYAETIALPEGTLVYPVSLSSFPKGTYTARLQMPDGTALHKKIVLQ
ncbi:MAG: T9SS type A sorting domain-containing protein, partial [Saprospiraceae bacterium]|nr:T9SS type A sorting domain-containing protein [Saprospiraceae bacterium]